MYQIKSHGKRKFIQRSNIKIKPKSLKDLRLSVNVKVHGDINEHVLPGFDKW